MRYEYRYTKRDVWDFIRIWRWRKENRRALLTRLLLCCVFWIYVVEFLFIKQGIAVQCIAALATALAVCGGLTYNVYRQVGKALLGVHVILMLEEGCLKVVGRSFMQHDLAGTGETICDRGLLLIPVNKEPPMMFVLLPERVFADEMERGRFLEELEHQKEYANQRQAELLAKEREQNFAAEQDALEGSDWKQSEWEQRDRGQGASDAATKRTDARQKHSDIAMQSVTPERRRRATDRVEYSPLMAHRRQTVVIGVILVGLVVAALCTRDWSAAGTDYMAPIIIDATYDAVPVPVEEQIRVLEGLGLTVGAEAESLVDQLISENPNYRSYIEEYPYTILLTSMGMPQYDYDTWEVIAYPEDVYWFDVEAFDLEESYKELLGVMEYLSDGEVLMELEDFNENAVDWEKGTGTLTMAFRCNGHSYTVDLTVMNDWIDLNALIKLNEVLEQEGCAAGLYACMNDGYGIILFYNDAEWAKDFERLTGLRLESMETSVTGWL